MIRTFVVLVALLATPVLAQDADAEAIAAMTKAIEDAGCSVTAENGDAVLAASGLDEADTMAVIAAMYAAGSVALEADGSMSLTSQECS